MTDELDLDAPEAPRPPRWVVPPRARRRVARVLASVIVVTLAAVVAWDRSEGWRDARALRQDGFTELGTASDVTLWTRDGPGGPSRSSVEVATTGQGAADCRTTGRSLPGSVMCSGGTGDGRRVVVLPVVPGTERVTIDVADTVDVLTVVPGPDGGPDYAVGRPQIPLADAATEPVVRYLDADGQDIAPQCGPRQPCFGVLVEAPRR